MTNKNVARMQRSVIRETHPTPDSGLHPGYQIAKAVIPGEAQTQIAISSL